MNYSEEFISKRRKAVDLLRHLRKRESNQLSLELQKKLENGIKEIEESDQSVNSAIDNASNKINILHRAIDDAIATLSPSERKRFESSGGENAREPWTLIATLEKYQARLGSISATLGISSAVYQDELVSLFLISLSLLGFTLSLAVDPVILSFWQKRSKRERYGICSLLIIITVCIVYFLETPIIEQKLKSLKVSEARLRMKRISDSLEEYRKYSEKNNLSPVYPISLESWEKPRLDPEDKELATMPQFPLSFTEGTVSLPKPPPPDPFNIEPGKYNTFLYHSNGEDWLMLSPGPDGIFDLTNKDIESYFEPENIGLWRKWAGDSQYDAKTGLGDIIWSRGDKLESN